MIVFTQAVFKREGVNRKGEHVGPLVLIDEEARDVALGNDPLARLGFVPFGETPEWLWRSDKWMTEDEAHDEAIRQGVTCLDVE